MKNLAINIEAAEVEKTPISGNDFASRYGYH
jgi:hypothetical protein